MIEAFGEGVGHGVPLVLASKLSRDLCVLLNLYLYAECFANLMISIAYKSPARAYR